MKLQVSTCKVAVNNDLNNDLNKTPSPFFETVLWQVIYILQKDPK